MNKERIKRIMEARFVTLIDDVRNIPRSQGHPVKKVLSTWSNTKSRGIFEKHGIDTELHNDGDWGGRHQETGLLVPVTNARKQNRMFETLVDILFNEKGKWTESRVQRAIKLIQEGARIGKVGSIGTGSAAINNMRIQENLEGHCLPLPTAQLGDYPPTAAIMAVRQIRNGIESKNLYWLGWRFTWNPEPPLYGQTLPDPSPPRTTLLKLIQARTAFRDYLHVAQGPCNNPPQCGIVHFCATPRG